MAGQRAPQPKPKKTPVSQVANEAQARQARDVNIARQSYPYGGRAVPEELGPYRPTDPRSQSMQSGAYPELGPYRPTDPRSQNMQSSGTPIDNSDKQLQDFLASLASPGLPGDSYASSIAGSLQSELQNQLDLIARMAETQQGLLASGKGQSQAEIDQALKDHQAGLGRVAQDYAAQAAAVDAQLSKMYAGTLSTVQESSKALSERLAAAGIDPSAFTASTGGDAANIQAQQSAQSGFSGRLDQLAQQSNADRERLGESIRQAGTTQLDTNYQAQVAQLQMQRYQQEAEARASYEAGLRSASSSGGGGGGGSSDPYAPQNFDDVLAMQKFEWQMQQDEAKANQGPTGKDYTALYGDYSTDILNPRNQYDRIALEAINSGNPDQYLNRILTDDATGKLDAAGYRKIMDIVGRARQSQQSRATGGTGQEAFQSRLDAAKKKARDLAARKKSTGRFN